MKRNGWIAALLFALALLATDSWARWRLLQRVTTFDAESRRAPAMDAASPTGFTGRQNIVILPESGRDGYHWILQTQQMVADGTLRVRRMEHDNAPFGRNVHWAAPLRWWISALAWLDHALRETPLAASIAPAAVWAGPALLGLFLVGFATLVARRFGSFASGVVTLALSGTYTIHEFFAAGAPDHHGLSLICAVLSLVCLLAGICPPAETSTGTDAARGDVTTRRWFISSGIATGLGLWISAATQLQISAATLGGAGFALWLKARTKSSDPESTLNPSSWRSWGFAAAGTSLAAFAIEYAPSAMSLRLEVNHPLHALGLFLAAELVRLIALRAQRLPHRLESAERRTGALALAGLAGIAIFAFVTRRESFALSDPFLWALHERYIGEFQSLTKKWSGLGAIGVCLFLSPLPVLAVLSGWLTRRDRRRFESAALITVLIPAAIMLLMALRQTRWLGIAFGVWLVALLISLPWLAATVRTWGRSLRFVFFTFGALLLIGPHATAIVVTALNVHSAHPRPSSADLQQLVVRDVARFLHQRTAKDAGMPTVLAGPSTSTQLTFHGGVDVIGTLYWENRDGLRAAAEIFAAPMTEVRARIVARRINYVVLFPWDSFAEPAVRLVAGLDERAPLPAGRFLATLESTPAPPDWLRPVPYSPTFPVQPGIGRVCVYEVVEPQPASEYLLRVALDFLERGDVGSGVQALELLLQQDPGNTAGLAALAQVRLAERSAPGFIAAFEPLVAHLNKRQSPELGDRVRIASVLAIGKRADLAREVLRAALVSADERSVRRLTPRELHDYLLLAARLGLEALRPELRELAFSLVATQREFEALQSPAAR